jgi:hypothetical protein
MVLGSKISDGPTISSMTFRSTLKERAAGFLLLCAMVPMAVLGYLIMVIHGLFGKTARARGAVRALDHFVNASVFNGHPWESLSSHAWREREQPWAAIVVRFLDHFQKDHCQRANKREQPVVDLVLEKGLHHQTIK